MSIFRFLDLFRVKEEKPKPVSDTVTMWEDDYLQVEILPSTNRIFLEEQLRLTYDLGEAHKTPEGFFTDVIERKENPFPTCNEEFRADILSDLVLSHHLSQYKTIEYYDGIERHIVGKQTKAFGFESFVLFFETDGEFVKNIWAVVKNTFAADQFDILVSALYNLGESYDLLLVDWNTNELVDLKNLKQIRRYLE